MSLDCEVEQKEETEPVFDFHGVYIPPRAIHLLHAREINGTDILLLIMVRSLTKYDKTGVKEGCWATNSYLAERIGISELRVSQIISKLKNLELIRTYEGQKGLQPKWRFLIVIWNEEGGINAAYTGGKGPAYTGGKGPAYTNIRINRTKKKGYINSDEKAVEKYTSWWNRLHSILHNSGRPVTDASKNSCIKAFGGLYKLLNQDDDRIIKCLDLYENHINEVDFVVYSALHFCKQNVFLTLESKLNRLDSPRSNGYMNTQPLEDGNRYLKSNEIW